MGMAFSRRWGVALFLSFFYLLVGSYGNLAGIG